MQLLATAQGETQGLAVNANVVVWASLRGNANSAKGVIASVPKTGGVVTDVAPALARPMGVAVDATNAYFTDFNAPTTGVGMAPLAGGGSVTTLGPGMPLTVAVAVDASAVYWSTLGGQVRSAPIGGGPITTLASGLGPLSGIAVDDTFVYVAQSSSPGSILMVRKDGVGPISAVAAWQVTPKKLAVDSTTAYWVIGGTGVNGEIASAPLAGAGPDGGPVTKLAIGQKSPNAIAVDDVGSVYWANAADGSIHKLKKGSGVATTIASHQVETRGLAVDDTSVYWTIATSDGGYDGGVVKITPK